MTMRTNPSELAEIFDAELRESEAETLYELGPRYNVAPTQHDPGHRRSATTVGRSRCIAGASFRRGPSR